MGCSTSKELKDGRKTTIDDFQELKKLNQGVTGCTYEAKDLITGDTVTVKLLAYLHSNKIIHHDLKPDNLLLNDKLELKICDFGMSKRVEVQDGECDRLYQMVDSLWYCSPEMLLGKEKYTAAIDVWSVGCIMAEMVTKKVLFDGSTSEEDQLNRIHSMMSSPELEMDLVGHGGIRRRYERLRTRVPASVLSDEGFDLLSGLLELNPGRRITARDALIHPWLVDFSCF